MSSEQRKAITLDNGVMVFFSYDTVIGFTRDGGTFPVFTAEKFSATTSKHRGAFVREHGGKLVAADEFRRLAQAQNLPFISKLTC